MTYSTLITLPHASSAPAQARQLIDQMDCLRTEVAMNARLLVSELVANAVRHAERDGEIGMHVAVVDDSLRVEVVDSGSGFTPRARTSESPLGSGWGLHLVDELSDRWGVGSSGPTRVWFEMDGAVDG